MSLLAMSLGLRFCVSRKGGTGGGWWVHPKGANSMAVSGLACRKALVGTGRAISVLFGITGLRNKPSYLVGPSFLAFTYGPFFSYARLAFPESLVLAMEYL